LKQEQNATVFSISEGINLLSQVNNRGDNTLKVRQIGLCEFIWLTSQVHQHDNLQACIWKKMIDIMKKKNEFRIVELKTYL